MNGAVQCSRFRVPGSCSTFWFAVLGSEFDVPNLFRYDDARNSQQRTVNPEHEPEHEPGTLNPEP
jgi:hypothetical protein